MGEQAEAQSQEQGPDPMVAPLRKVIADVKCASCGKQVARARDLARHLKSCKAYKQVVARQKTPPPLAEGVTVRKVRKVARAKAQKPTKTTPKLKAARARWAATYMKKHREAGLCIACPRKLGVKRKGKTRCQVCADKHYASKMRVKALVRKELGK